MDGRCAVRHLCPAMKCWCQGCSTLEFAHLLGHNWLSDTLVGMVMEQLQSIVLEGGWRADASGDVEPTHDETNTSGRSGGDEDFRKRPAKLRNASEHLCERAERRSRKNSPRRTQDSEQASEKHHDGGNVAIRGGMDSATTTGRRPTYLSHPHHQAIIPSDLSMHSTHHVTDSEDASMQPRSVSTYEQVDLPGHAVASRANRMQVSLLFTRLL